MHESNSIVKWPALIDPLLIVANLRTQSLLPPIKIQSEKCAQNGVSLRVREFTRGIIPFAPQPEYPT